MRTIPWPDGEERDNANLMFSPDGKLLYFLGNEILIFETEKFTQVDKWDLSNLEEGLGRSASASADSPASTTPSTNPVSSPRR
jgi:hypothetical protein